MVQGNGLQNRKASGSNPDVSSKLKKPLQIKFRRGFFVLDLEQKLQGRFVFNIYYDISLQTHY